ncbi:hypothetical protein, partial [Bacillus thuringiensis]|uniref:hypothetical protein n=1 Tax=Bacillus thuringiensis TaxID=1428 RepID=UPI001155E9F0
MTNIEADKAIEESNLGHEKEGGTSSEDIIEVEVENTPQLSVDKIEMKTAEPNNTSKETDNIGLTETTGSTDLGQEEQVNRVEESTASSVEPCDPV